MSDSFISTTPEILFITSYPPRECGIATYSQDLIKAINSKFENSFVTVVCALESGRGNYVYNKDVKYVIDTSDYDSFVKAASEINKNENICMIMLQHEFGFFKNIYENEFLHFLSLLTKPVIISFHTVLPNPSKELYLRVKRIIEVCEFTVVMTQNSAEILIRDYDAPIHKIEIIPHGIHLVPHLDKNGLKEKYGLKGRKILSTFGLISSGKSFETTIEALPAIVKLNPEVLFLIIGKTHPEILKTDGEKYRESLVDKVNELELQNNVQFINQYLPLKELLDYLQLSDIYLFTSKDPHQAVSGTFSYALSCCCPVISTPIPQAKEILKDDAGIIVDFQSSKQLSDAVNLLLGDDDLMRNLSNNGLQRIIPAAWENVSIKYGELFSKIHEAKIVAKYKKPIVILNHVKQLTSHFGIIQFSKINQPDFSSGYTLDDNARAMVAMCKHYELTGNNADIYYIKTYLHFIRYCQQPSGNFLNYVDENKNFTEQNYSTNLEDSNGRAIWALGYLLSIEKIIPEFLLTSAKTILYKSLPEAVKMHSTRAMAFTIKGLCYNNIQNQYPESSSVIKILANRLVNMYNHESSQEWEWFESYLTYGNSILPEALLSAYVATCNPIYRDIAQKSFDFLLSKTFKGKSIKPISNKNWLQKGGEHGGFGEQPIDVAYTILALDKFYKVFKDPVYLNKMDIAFNWFLGNNHLGQIIYNPCTGGCFDGLEEFQVNLNQGAESTVSYLMARLTIEKYIPKKQKPRHVPAHRTSFPHTMKWMPTYSSKPIMAR